MTTEKFADWGSEYVNTLPNSAFAYVDPKYGKDSDDKSLRHLPHHNDSVKSATENASVDLAHLRNALARVSQISAPAVAKQKALNHLRAHANVLLKKVRRNVTNDSDFSEDETFLNDCAEEIEVILGEMDGTAFVDSPAASVVILPGEQIFKVGKWQADEKSKEWTAEDLQEIAKCYSEALDWFTPPLKDSHSDEVHSNKHGEKNIGEVKNVRFEDPYLLADFEIDGKFHRDVIEPNRMPHKSAEIFTNIEKGGKKFKYLLKAVALLGISTPAVAGLNKTGSNFLSKASDDASHRGEGFSYSMMDNGSVVRFSYVVPTKEGENVADPKTDVTENKEKNMTTEKNENVVSVEQFSMLKKMLDDQAAKLDAVTKEKADLASKFSEVSAVAVKYEESIKKFAEEARVRENEVQIDAFIRSGKVSPAMKSDVLAVFDALQTGPKVHKFGEGEKTVEKASVEVFKSLIESLPAMWNQTEQAADTSINENPAPDSKTEEFCMMSGKSIPKQGMDLDIKAKAYIAEAHKQGKHVEYRDAILAVSTIA